MSEQKFHAAPANGGSSAEKSSDDIDVRIEEELTEPTPPVQAVEGEGADAIERESTKTRRTRSKKMSLRIPDDEVARPSERAPAVAPVADDLAPISTPRPAIAPSRIIAINPPSNRSPAHDADDKAAAAADDDDAMHDAPTRHDVSDLDAPDAADSSDRLTPEPATHPSPRIEAKSEPSFEIGSQSDLASDHSSPTLADVDSGNVADSAKLPVAAMVTDDSASAAKTLEVVVSSALAESLAKVEADDGGVDVDVDTEEPTAPASDEGEIEVADLVSIESVPVPPKHKSVPPAKPPVPLAYQSGDFPAVPSGPDVKQPVPPIVVVPPAAPAVAAAAAAPAVQAPLGPQASPPAEKAPEKVIADKATAEKLAAAHDAKKRVRPWWEELFNDDFVRTMAKVTDKQIAKEVSFIEESLGVESGSALLDLGCGTGLHAIELTKRGYQVVGFDLSLAMLARAADEAQERKQKLNFVQGDMREMAFEELFDGVYSWNTSFGFFDEEKNAQVVTRVHRALKKGGQFLLDVVNRDYIVRQSPSLAWFEGDGCICMDEMQVDFITSRMRVKRTMMMDDGRSREIEYSMRVYSLHELGKLLHEHGFRVAEVSGRLATPGVYFGNESPRTLILAEKR